MDHFKLNHDILLDIIGLCDRSSTAALMRTCSTLYEDSARYVLAGEVRITGAEDLFSFMLFLSRQTKPSRFRFLHQFSLSVGRIDEELAWILEFAFKKMSRLRTLTIKNAESLLQSRNNLRMAISRIPSLRRLELYDAEMLTCHLVKELRVGLKSLRLSYAQRVHDGSGDIVSFLESVGPDQVGYYHPVSLCKAVARTLHELHIEYDMGEFPLPNDSVIYPHMRKLVLQDDLPDAWPYTRKFPNLTHLSVTSVHGMYDTFAASRGDYFMCRQENAVNHLEDTTWEHLQEYEGQLLGLYLLAPPRPIPRLLFTDAVIRPYLSLLGPVLDAATPSHLEIAVVGNPLGPSPRKIPALLRKPGCALLKSLKIDITLDHQDREGNIGACTESLLRSLALSRLSSLHITLKTGERVDPTRPRIEADPADPDGVIINYVADSLAPVEQSLNEFEPLAYAHRVADAVPTMQDVTIRVCGPRDKKERTARFRRGEDGDMGPIGL